MVVGAHVTAQLAPRQHEGWIMKIALTIIGVLALAMGLLWIGQGTGVIAWPASSFMIDQRPWALRGAVLALVGVGLLIWSRRR